MESKNKKLRSGYTTGACAAAAAKAATLLLLQSKSAPGNPGKITETDILLPDGSRVTFAVQKSGYGPMHTAYASIIKDAGDDPDITNGAEIRAEVSEMAEISFPVSDSDLQSGPKPLTEILIYGGTGVGKVTKPGLALPVGEHAINPVPRKMIRDGVLEALGSGAACKIETSTKTEHAPISWALCAGIKVTISVPQGEELATKTLNERLGIIGGISILGTTGIVRPLSTDAYTACIKAGLDVAKAMGRSTVVLSTGRTSEKAHMKRYGFPDDSYVMMGDHVHFSVLNAWRRGFNTIHLCAQWAKMLKIAMSTPQTHVRHGAIEATETVAFLKSKGIAIPSKEFNTTREIFHHIMENSTARDALRIVCRAAKEYVQTIAYDTPVIVNLASYEGEIIADSE